MEQALSYMRLILFLLVDARTEETIRDSAAWRVASHGWQKQRLKSVTINTSGRGVKKPVPMTWSSSQAGMNCFVSWISPCELVEDAAGVLVAFIKEKVSRTFCSGKVGVISRTGNKTTRRWWTVFGNIKMRNCLPWYGKHLMSMSKFLPPVGPTFVHSLSTGCFASERMFQNFNAAYMASPVRKIWNVVQVKRLLTAEKYLTKNSCNSFLWWELSQSLTLASAVPIGWTFSTSIPLKDKLSPSRNFEYTNDHDD